MRVLLSAVFVQIFFAGNLIAQNGPVSTGSKATGDGGTVSYTVGQVAFTTATGSSGSLMGGLQQPYIIESITGIEDNRFSVGYTVYPNPTVDYVFLKSNIDKVINQKVVYTLYNFKGQIIDKKEVLEKMTFIPMKEYGSATYFLKVMVGDSEMKSFRIIKN